MPTTVDIAIVTYGGRDDLPRCVDALRAQGPLLGRIVVVDNASPDGTAEAAAALEGVEVVRNANNRGYAAAMNQALAATSAPYLLSLNADCVLAPGYVASCVEALERDSGLAAVTGVLTLPDGDVDSTGITLTRAGLAMDRDRHRMVDAIDTTEPFGVSGAAAVWRRAALVTLGGAPWWEWLFVYWDDVEIAARLRRRQWSFAVVPGARAVHRRGADRADPTFVEAHAYRNRLATLARHLGWRGVLAPGPALVTIVTGMRLALRHRAALRQAKPAAAVRCGIAARGEDAGLTPLDRTALAAHPWGAWLRSQIRPVARHQSPRVR